MMHRNPRKNPASMNMEGNQSHMLLSSSTFPNSNSQFSTISKISKSSPLKYVYRRNKHQKYYAIATTGQSALNKDSCGFSSVVNDTELLSSRQGDTISEWQLQVGVSSSHTPIVNSCGVLSSRALQVHVPEEFPERNVCRSKINHMCSSSKSNRIAGADSADIDANKTGECSLRLLSAENQIDDIPEKDFCIAYLKRHGLLGNGHIRTSGVGDSINGTCTSRSCKTCGGYESTTNLLICDDCDSAFHAWCCRPRVNDIPIDEWFCNSCEKKKQKLLKEMKLRKLQNITEGESSSYPVDTSNVVLTCLDMMLLDTEPHKTEVRIGKGFQADVPEWSGPNLSHSDLVGEPLEIGLSESERLINQRLHNSARVSPIGNWLQCREVICGIRKDIDGAICGKWRRAPLSEVQSDDWDCFSAVLWDPAHADCAAPQELETVEVLRQLKYIQMLKPTSMGKRQILSHPRRKVMQGPSKRARKP